ncbi:MAG: hypothetical protein GXP46_02955 [Deferribacteres bacterium]|nr:hypothetical protein [Deferribacteres bacterium]
MNAEKSPKLSPGIILLLVYLVYSVIISFIGLFRPVVIAGPLLLTGYKAAFWKLIVLLVLTTGTYALYTRRHWSIYLIAGYMFYGLAVVWAELITFLTAKDRLVHVYQEAQELINLPVNIDSRSVFPALVIGAALKTVLYTGIVIYLFILRKRFGEKTWTG